MYDYTVLIHTTAVSVEVSGGTDAASLAVFSLFVFYSCAFSYPLSYEYADSMSMYRVG